MIKIMFIISISIVLGLIGGGLVFLVFKSILLGFLFGIYFGLHTLWIHGREEDWW